MIAQLPAIPVQMFEVIRDKIAEILSCELGRQYELNNTVPKVRKVWTDRFVPIDGDTEMPTVNVSFHQGEYGNASIIKSEGAYTYNIDVYTTGIATTGMPGDQKAFLTMARIAGMIRAILTSPIYVSPPLGGLSNVIRTKVLSVGVYDKGTVKDALSGVIGRLQFQVTATESVVNVSGGTDLNESSTAVYIGESDQGMYYEFDPNGQPLVLEDDTPVSDENNNTINTENPT